MHRGRPCKPEVEEATWKLVWLSRDLGDEALAAFAGKLLALTGPLDATVIAFSVPTFAANSGSAASAPAPAPQRGGRAGAAQQVRRPWLSVMGLCGVSDQQHGSAPVNATLLPPRGLAPDLTSADIHPFVRPTICMHVSVEI